MTEKTKRQEYEEIRDKAQTEMDKIDAKDAWYICDCGAQLRGHQFPEDGLCPACKQPATYQRLT